MTKGRKRNIPRPSDSSKLPLVCQKAWDELEGDDTQRYCETCMHSVWNLSDLTRAEVAALLAFHDDQLCVYVKRDSSGRPTGPDCEPGSMYLGGAREFFPESDEARAEKLGHDRTRCPLCRAKAAALDD